MFHIYLLKHSRMRRLSRMVFLFFQVETIIGRLVVSIKTMTSTAAPISSEVKSNFFLKKDLKHFFVTDTGQWAPQHTVPALPESLGLRNVSLTISKFLKILKTNGKNPLIFKSVTNGNNRF